MNGYRHVEGVRKNVVDYGDFDKMFWEMLDNPEIIGLRFYYDPEEGIISSVEKVFTNGGLEE